MVSDDPLDSSIRATNKPLSDGVHGDAEVAADMWVVLAKREATRMVWATAQFQPWCSCALGGQEVRRLSARLARAG